MYRTAITTAPRSVFRASIQTRAAAAFSTTVRTMAEGDTGATRSGGGAQGDAFSKREKANEDYTIKMREKEKLQELKRSIAQQHEHLEKLSKHIEETEKSSSGSKK